MGHGVEARRPGVKGIELLTVDDDLAARASVAASRSEIADGNREVVRLTDEQLYLLNTLRGVRRAAVVGGAGTGKTMLAIAKAKQLATEGFETLLVCFNSPLARVLATRPATSRSGPGTCTVSTFHQLAEDLGREAGTLPRRSRIR